MTRSGDGDDELVVVKPVVSAPAGDPTSADELIELGAGPRLPRWQIVAGLCVLIAGVVTAVSLKNAGHHAAPAPTAPPSTPQTSAAQRPQGLSAVQVQDLAIAADGTLFVLGKAPFELVAVDRDGAILNRVFAPNGAQLVVADATRVWTVAPGSGYSDVFAYARLPVLRTVSHEAVGAVVTAAAALDGELWMATDHGVYLVRLGEQGEPARLPGFAGAVATIAADPSRHRLLGVSTRYDLLTIDARGVHVVRELHDILPESIAVTAHAIWVVGFGRVGGSRFGRLDPHTLRVTPVGQPDFQAPQGAQAWPGESVLWIKLPYSGSIVCHDERTGNPVGAFVETDSPVVSVNGTAYAVRSGTVARLPTTSQCPG